MGKMHLVVTPKVHRLNAQTDRGHVSCVKYVMYLMIVPFTLYTLRKTGSLMNSFWFFFVPWGAPFGLKGSEKNLRMFF